MINVASYGLYVLCCRLGCGIFVH